MIQTALLLRYGTCLHVAFLLSNVLWLFFEEVDYSGAVPICHGKYTKQIFEDNIDYVFITGGS